MWQCRTSRMLENGMLDNRVDPALNTVNQLISYFIYLSGEGGFTSSLMFFPKYLKNAKSCKCTTLLLI